MNTARPAFEGEEVWDTFEGVLKGHRAWTALPAETPTAIRRLLRRTLEKDSGGRLSDMADARLEIEEAQELAGADGSRDVIQPGGTTRLQRTLRWAIAPTLAVAVITTIVVWSPWHAVPVPLAQHLSVDLG